VTTTAEAPQSASTNLEKPIGGHDKDVFVQVWRGIAALLVIYYHFVDRLPPAAVGVDGPASLPFYSGTLGVLVFFVISGFLITQSLVHSRNLASFYAKRISRIWPLFILASILIFIFVQFFQPPVVVEGPRHFYSQERNLVDLFGTIFFLEDLGFEWIDGAFWSILVELKFYFWIGLLAWLNPRKFVAYFAIASVIISGTEMALHVLHSPGARLLNGIFIAQYLPFFAIGALLFRGAHRELLTLNVSLAILSSGLKIASNPNFEIEGTVIFGLVLIAVLGCDALLLRHRLFLMLGDYSYSWYLFHQVIGLTLVQAIAPRLGLDLAVAAALATTLAISIAGSWAAEWRFRSHFYQALFRAFALIGLDRAKLGGANRPERQASAPESPATE
jgi:peptidoglycan/LPS O-acetylase OafA/YrhL